jgi:hypothetical protein
MLQCWKYHFGGIYLQGFGKKVIGHFGENIGKHKRGQEKLAILGEIRDICNTVTAIYLYSF